jgi:hypothetical protein
MSGYGMVVCSGSIEMVRSAGVFPSGGVVVMGMTGVTTLRPCGMGRQELPLPFKVVSSSSVDCLRTVCSDGDPL